MAEGFTATQYEAAYPPGIERHWWMLARTWMVSTLLHASGARGAPMLEIGCGPGVVVQALRALGHDCRGVELAATEPLPAVREQVRTGCDALLLPKGEREPIETILLLDVIEHMDAPEALLRALPDAFPALRRVLVTVPARRELWSNYDEYYGHRIRYGRDELALLAAASGWRCARLEYAFRLLYPLALMLAWLGRERPVRLSAPSGPPAVLLHRVVAAMLWLEWRLLPAALPGSSLVACFERAGR